MGEIDNSEERDKRDRYTRREIGGDKKRLAGMRESGKRR